MAKVSSQIENINNNILSIYYSHKFEYSIRIDEEYYYLFFVADDNHPNTRNIVHLVEKLGFENYDKIGNHCYAHYYRIKI